VKRVGVLVTKIKTPYVKLKLSPLSPQGKSLGLRAFENRVLRIIFGSESEEMGGNRRNIICPR
jgi:hypothetical protein